MTPHGRRRLPVYFNGQFFCHRLKTGVQRFALETLRALDAQLAGPDASIDMTVLIPPDAETDVSLSNIAIARCGRRTGYDWEQIDLRFACGRRMLVSPCNSGPLFKRNQIPVIHDTVVLDHPEWFDPRFVRQCRRVLPWLCRWSKRIVTVSEFSRGRIAATTGVDPNRIDVVPNGVAASFEPPSRVAVAEMRAAFALDRRFVLTVGSIEPRKNLAGLLAAWRLVEASFAGHELVVAGGKDSIFAATATELLPPRVRLLGYVDDRLLPALYGAADAFAYPSLGEALPSACRGDEVAAAFPSSPLAGEPRWREFAGRPQSISTHRTRPRSRRRCRRPFATATAVLSAARPVVLVRRSIHGTGPRRGF